MRLWAGPPRGPAGHRKCQPAEKTLAQNATQPSPAENAIAGRRPTPACSRSGLLVTTRSLVGRPRRSPSASQPSTGCARFTSRLVAARSFGAPFRARRELWCVVLSATMLQNNNVAPPPVRRNGKAPILIMQLGCNYYDRKYKPTLCHGQLASSETGASSETVCARRLSCLIEIASIQCLCPWQAPPSGGPT